MGVARLLLSLVLSALLLNPSAAEQILTRIHSNLHLRDCQPLRHPSTGQGTRITGLRFTDCQQKMFAANFAK